ncbi:Hypothetical protein BSM4216_1937 [Bacillus smithii]|nr:Hypothetical protein BSM4216_1937 [Bacillus smithii]
MDVKKEPYHKRLFFSGSAITTLYIYRENVDPIFERSYSRIRVEGNGSASTCLLVVLFWPRKVN